MANETTINIEIDTKQAIVIAAVVILCAIAIIAVEQDRPIEMYNITYVDQYNDTPDWFYCDPFFESESNYSREPGY